MKRRINFLVLGSIAVLLTVSVHAQSVKLGDFSAQAAAVTEFEVNGLKVIVKRRALSPTVAGGLFIRGGARNIDDKNAGIENLMLATAVQAGQKMPRATVRRELARLGSSIGSAVSNDYSAVSFGSTRASFDRVWEIFTEVTLNPAFAAEDVGRSRSQIQTGLNEIGTSPESALQTLQDKVIYAGHPYANDMSGTSVNIARFSADELRSYHKNLMQTSRLLLVFVGDLDPELVKSRVAATFGKLPRGDYKEPPLAALDHSKATLDITTKSVQTDYVRGTFAAPSLRDPDYYAMRTAIALLQSAVFQEVRVKRNLSYAPDADLGERLANTASISVTSVNPTEAVTVMLAEIEKLRQGSVDDDTIKQISGFFLTTHYIKQETNAAQAAELAQYELIGGGWRRSLEFLDRMRAVKASEVQAAAQKYMKNLRFIVVGNPTHIDRSIFLRKAEPPA